jgi:hypothetical protein
MRRMTFLEFIAIREGLWLNDDKAVEGLSKTPIPKPRKRKRNCPIIRNTVTKKTIPN